MRASSWKPGWEPFTPSDILLIQKSSFTSSMTIIFLYQIRERRVKMFKKMSNFSHKSVSSCQVNCILFETESENETV